MPELYPTPDPKLRSTDENIMVGYIETMLCGSVMREYPAANYKSGRNCIVIKDDYVLSDVQTQLFSKLKEQYDYSVMRRSEYEATIAAYFKSVKQRVLERFATGNLNDNTYIGGDDCDDTTIHIVLPI